MSRAFVKNDGDVPEEPVARQASGRPNYVTRSGLDMLEAKVLELDALRARLAAARKPGEPAALPLRQAELDLSYYEGRIKSARLVDNRGLAAADVRFGATVRVRDPGGTEKEFRIVGEDEADPGAGRLNWASPLAAALIGAKAGDTVKLVRKDGTTELQVLSVGYPAQ